ncbi:hypothetical protein BJ912DRAFT_985989 [Pholiota molesta]|nr:hypothetical protein BJ912DRAFT_985989 [Pholiota molesta]
MASSLSSADVEDQTTPEPASAGQEPRTLDELEAALTSTLNQILAPELLGMMLHHRQPLLDAIAAIRHLRVYRATHPDEQSQTLNLGSAKESASSYDRLGLTLNTIPWQESHYNKLIESLVQRQLNERISEFWEEKYDFLINKLKAYKKFMTISGGPGASARLLFLLLESLYQEDLDLIPVVLPDLKLNVQPDDPVILSYTPGTGPKRTTLTSPNHRRKGRIKPIRSSPSRKFNRKSNLSGSLQGRLFLAVR